MQTPIEFLDSIHTLLPEELETKGVELLKAYVAQENSMLKTKEIITELEPYVNETVKSFWKNLIVNRDQIMDDVPAGWHPCFCGVCVERTFSSNESENIEGVLQSEYETFASYINKLASAGRIGFGVFATAPVKMALAVISPSRRYMLLFFTFTKLTWKEQKQVSNIFTHEGELPHMIEHIEFYSSEDRSGFYNEGELPTMDKI
jgi:hypothetical protein